MQSHLSIICLIVGMLCLVLSFQCMPRKECFILFFVLSICATITGLMFASSKRLLLLVGAILVYFFMMNYNEHLFFMAYRPDVKLELKDNHEIQKLENGERYLIVLKN